MFDLLRFIVGNSINMAPPLILRTHHREFVLAVAVNIDSYTTHQLSARLAYAFLVSSSKTDI
jgi:hypothetical protein